MGGLDIASILIEMSSFSEKGLLGELEQLALLAVIRLGTEAHAPAIREAIADRTGIDLVRGTVYVTLDRLDRKGYLTSRFGEPTPERGGKAKRLFAITADGKRALADAARVLALMRGRTAPARPR
jgi:PadR family transcriptional regulator PadR